jgi:hypothetical protein
MKTDHYLAALATIILALTGFAYAQQGSFNAEEGNGKWAAEQPPVSPAYTQYAYFNPEIGNVPPPVPFTAPAIHRHAGTSAKLEIADSTKLAEVTLKAGEYFVQHVDTGKEHFVEFSQVVENDYVLEGASVYERQVVARANCTLEPLNSVVARTELLPKANGMMARLEIRGEKAAHLF